MGRRHAKDCRNLIDVWFIGRKGGELVEILKHSMALRMAITIGAEMVLQEASCDTT
jgi:hypothetical protein